MENESQLPGSEDLGRLAAVVRDLDRRLRRVELRTGLSKLSQDEWLESLRQPQDADNGTNAIMGRWPGDESDEVINEWLMELS